jgi:chemotaxis protein methyltransferase CheR
MTEPEEPEQELETLQIKLLLEGVYQHAGYDFRDYAFASIRRRILDRIRAEELATVSALQDRVLHDRSCMDRLVMALTVHVTAMFRDPGFYLAIRQFVVPVLLTYPFARIWHAGCSSGEEVYSLAILLKEEGIYDRCRIYATDLSEPVLRRAKEGVFPLASMREYTENYQKAGGKAAFSEYYTARYDGALFMGSLRDNIVFAPHNLVTDGSFNEFNLILCRNVMIYFNKGLAERVHALMHQSLARRGILGLGRKESLRFTPFENLYEPIEQSEGLYRKLP